MKISVIIPVYNAEKYVSQAVESALQFDEVCEVILIEDKSPDHALEVCEQLTKKYDRVKLYQHPDKGNHGAGPTRNLGIEKSTGDFIAFLDADDYFLPNRFDAERELFKKPEIEGVYGALGVHYYTEKAKEQYYSLFGDRLTTVYKRHEPKDVFPGQIYMLGSFGLFSIDALTIRKDSLMKKMDPLFKSSLRLHQDTEFLFRLSYYLNLYPGILDQAIAIRGVHEDNRITQVDSKKINPATTRVLLWKEVDTWAENETTLPENIKLHIKRMYRSFQIANASTSKKWGMIMKFLVTDYRSIRSGIYNINFRNNLF
ncbi:MULTISPECIES: glycosyltransferase family 2 protein [Chryseobacterium]|uniref:Glycosyltransferase family 2 protein n=1 Tax=Chryseobacterium pennae TaxID=2258962 RepID=A0A3D9CF59_9FLAO|nr:MULTISPECIES: glycosyltransferase family 2 protein [Chryseobacterium]MCS4303111.1 glycosyltransferase involved in cell wall biosynthesis [Chryseobacterium sp. BIGb0232]REC64151.1 glycosyltransferase family 2 protein [Chryseobacterium pennae]ROS14602.1 glycosyl transferase family 2 [Chryseobacterium nakagawai]